MTSGRADITTRGSEIAQLKTRRQETAERTKDAGKRIGAQLRQLQTHETRAERKRETRRKIFIGTIVRAAQKPNADISLDWLEEQIQALTRPDDRALFGLDGKPSADTSEADKTEPAATRPAPPVTSWQKQLLARLVEEYPRFARELGVNPDEPELEKPLVPTGLWDRDAARKKRAMRSRRRHRRLRAPHRGRGSRCLHAPQALSSMRSNTASRVECSSIRCVPKGGT